MSFTTNYRGNFCRMALDRDRASRDVVESCMWPRVLVSSHKAASHMMHVPGKMIDREYGDNVLCKTPLQDPRYFLARSHTTCRISTHAPQYELDCVRQFKFIDAQNTR